jgi:hypothetical protein
LVHSATSMIMFHFDMGVLFSCFVQWVEAEGRNPSAVLPRKNDGFASLNPSLYQPKPL